MFIIEMSEYESDFITKSTKTTGASLIRTFDVNHEMSLFAYYYEDYIHLKLRRYKDQETTMDDWLSLKAVGLLYPDINLADVSEIYIDQEENQLHVQIPNYTHKRNDYK
ncbi:MAG: hypothetical protein L0J63_11990 [Tetragenococcus koreensis]|nr:hypothetical protein [Tetragenococcus koreensis]